MNRPQPNHRTSGRARRHAMSPRSILEQMPGQLRRHHIGAPSTNHSTEEVFVPKPTHRREHVRQNAMIWDDLVSIMRLEVMKTERDEKHLRSSLPTQRFGTTPSCPRFDNHDHDSQSAITSSPSIDSQRAIVSAELSGREISLEMKSPPRVARMPYCFDSNSSRERLTNVIGRVARRLSPVPFSFGRRNSGSDKSYVAHSGERLTSAIGKVARRLSPPVFTRQSFRFGRGNTGCDNASYRTHCDTYISDDEDGTSSLEYSDDDSDVERAILASAAVFSQSGTMSEEGDANDVQCAICLECTNSSDIAKNSGCGHSFCFACIDRWAAKKNECPLCKKRFHSVASRRRVRWY